MLDPATQMALQLLYSPRFMVPKMTIKTRDGKVDSLEHAGMYVEQMELIDSLARNRYTIALKARKVGVTTAGVGFFGHRMMFFPDAYDVIGVGHEQGACDTMVDIMALQTKGYREARSHMLPSGLGLAGLITPTRPWHARRISYKFPSHIRSFFTLLAGGRGSGRSKTVRGVIFTESAFYPRGSSALQVSADSEEGADEQLVQSVLASVVDDEHLRVLFDSTANGPTGYFHKIVVDAQNPKPGAEPMTLLFFPWFRSVQYRAKPVPGFERTDEEEKLAALHGLDNWQLQWRRNKLAKSGSLQRFRKEYPATEEEPFLVGTGMWFNTELLNQILVACDPSVAVQGWRIYEEPQPNRVYVLGADPSGGTGRDGSVAHIFRDDGEQVAVFSSQTVEPYPFADIIADASDRYNRARILCEDNGRFGRGVNERLSSLGANKYVTPNGKDFYIDTALKTAMSSYTKECIHSGRIRLRDRPTVRELMHVREQRDGRIEADPPNHDDHFTALNAALWNLRPILRTMPAVPEASRLEQLGTSRREHEQKRVVKVLQRAAPERPSEAWDRMFDKITSEASRGSE